MGNVLEIKNVCKTYTSKKGIVYANKDISFDLNSEEINTLESVVHDLYEYWEDFNAYDHAVMWYQTEGKYGGPTDLRILIDDAEDIKDMYYKLYKKISETVH